MLSILEYIEENVVGRDAGFYGPYGERKGKHHFSFSRKKRLVEVEYNFANFAVESLFNPARKAEHISKDIVVQNA